MNKRILISGASIAGLTLAYWLEHYGFRPTVIERAPKLREDGNGVDIRKQAIEVAKRMGIMPIIQKKARDTIGMSFVNADNKVIGRIDMNESRQKNSSGEVEIMRGDLVDLLYEVTNNVEYIFNDSIQK
ncbi:FAD-dependent monooxygenase [Shimazuella sp. AN120528]|uniref:FAD-dependent monooxygenase n=1 Tax=Shimazuella soli TaxID=1892854 RepID=UPI001F0E29E0|nr:FAD-dependent monooxygenase [Shimazuella soli]MCH5585520.1 FAD-dependent monooxygenase [Shimazuella soli]